MNEQARQMGADCSGCPFREGESAPTEVGAGAREVYVVGGVPRRVDAVRGRPFMSADGALLNQLLAFVGLPREAATLTNAVLCRRPPHTSEGVGRAAAVACAPRLRQELTGKRPLILAMGKHAVHALTGRSPLEAWRGYPLPGVPGYEHALVFPTWHPEDIHVSPGLLPAIKTDLQRAFALWQGKLPDWTWPPFVFAEGPESTRMLEAILAEGRAGVDVETAGFDPFSSVITCFGIAGKAGAVALDFPFANKDTARLVNEILGGACQKVLHNGQFDATVLKAWGLPRIRIDFDTLVAHRLLAPQQPHNLGFVASTFFPAPRWKTMRRAGMISLREYNAMDAYMTVLLSYAMEELL